MVWPGHSQNLHHSSAYHHTVKMYCIIFQYLCTYVCKEETVRNKYAIIGKIFQTITFLDGLNKLDLLLLFLDVVGVEFGVGRSLGSLEVED